MPLALSGFSAFHSNDVLLTKPSEQRERLLQEIEFFLQMSAKEQKVSLDEHLPSVEQYIQRRMGTSAVGVCLAMTE